MLLAKFWVLDFVTFGKIQWLQASFLVTAHIRVGLILQISKLSKQLRYFLSGNGGSQFTFIKNSLAVVTQGQTLVYVGNNLFQ